MSLDRNDSVLEIREYLDDSEAGFENVIRREIIDVSREYDLFADIGRADHKVVTNYDQTDTEFVREIALLADAHEQEKDTEDDIMAIFDALLNRCDPKLHKPAKESQGGWKKGFLGNNKKG